MSNTVYLSIKYNGQPMSLSRGIPLITRRGIEPGVQLELRTPFNGGLVLPVETLGVGPGSGEEGSLNAGPCVGWGSRRKIPIHPMDAEYLKPITDPRAHTQFHSLTSVEPFWVRDSFEGTHVLMDVRNRRLVRVSPVIKELRREFWFGLSQGMKGFSTNAAEDRTFAPEWALAGYYDRGVWLCLHPAPYVADAPVDWTFDGHAHVAFDIDGDDPREQECFAHERIMLGYAGSPSY